MKTSRLPQTNVLHVRWRLQSHREKVKKRCMDQINKTWHNDISISYVHLIFQWVAFISIMIFLSCKICSSDIFLPIEIVIRVGWYCRKWIGDWFQGIRYCFEWYIFGDPFITKMSCTISSHQKLIYTVIQMQVTHVAVDMNCLINHKCTIWKGTYCVPIGNYLLFCCHICCLYSI